MDILIIITSILLRSFLHACLVAALYFISVRFVKISKWRFVLIALFVFSGVEYLQYQYGKVVSIGLFTLARDMILIGILALGVGFLLYFKERMSKNSMFLTLTLITVLVVVLSYLIDQFYHGPEECPLYKYIVDVFAYLSGPFLIYPLIVKYFYNPKGP